MGAAAVGNPPMLLPDPARAAGNAAKLFAVAEALFERTGAVLAALDGFTAVVSGRFDAADGGVCPPARGASDGLGTGTTGGARAGVEADARAGAGGGAEVTAPRAATFVAARSGADPSLALRLGLCQHLPLLLKFCAGRRERGLFTFCVELRGRRRLSGRPSPSFGALREWTRACLPRYERVQPRLRRRVRHLSCRSESQRSREKRTHRRAPKPSHGGSARQLPQRRSRHAWRRCGRLLPEHDWLWHG